ncbi:LapA family protein [Neisseria sp. Ec49-e6-T10]|uniref:LapA family protein n=1 Tax=Neisseria sp. Ec49-e6-T10 TaxID=3140744 RepID=UPI003EB96C87
MRYIYLSLKVVILLFLLIIAFNNFQDVSFYWIFGNNELPLIVLLFAFFVLGIFVGILGMMGRSWRSKRQISSLKKTSKQLQKEIQKQNNPTNTDQ